MGKSRPLTAWVRRLTWILDQLARTSTDIFLSISLHAHITHHTSLTVTRLCLRVGNQPSDILTVLVPKLASHELLPHLLITHLPLPLPFRQMAG